MSGESFINLEAVAFNCIDAIHSEPPQTRIAYAITSVLQHSSPPIHKALLELLRTLFNEAGYLKDREAVPKSAQPDPTLAQGGPHLESLFEESSALLAGNIHASPVRQAFAQIETLKQARIQAEADSNLETLRELERALTILRSEAPDAYRRALLTNQIAVNASARYALADAQGLANAFESLCTTAKEIPASRARSTIAANACYLATLLHQHDGDVTPLERAKALVPEIDLSERSWALMTNVVVCLLVLHEEAPDRYGALLDEVLSLIPREVPEVLPSAAVDVAQNLVIAYSTLARLTHDERYVVLANELSAMLLEMPHLSEVRAGQLKTNHANRLVQWVEVGNLPDAEMRELIMKAVSIARDACRISAQHTVPGEHRATDLECLARCLRELAQLQDDEQERISMLKEALGHAEEAMLVTPAQARAWARHAEMRNHILFDLVSLEHNQWAASFLNACEETLQSGYASALTHWLYGHRLIDQGSVGREAFESMLLGAQLQESPVVRAERYMDILSHLRDVSPEEVEEWRFEVLHEVLHGLLADYRKLLWSPRGEHATRAAASQLSWLGTVLAELTISRDGDARQALRALGTVANGIWAMNVSLTTPRDFDEQGADLFLADRLLLQAADEVAVPDYEAEIHSPTLVVLVAGPTRGWAIVRRVGQEDLVIPLPECSDAAAKSTVEGFNTVLDTTGLRRGSASPTPPSCQQWLQSTVAQPLIDAGLDLGEWVAWCPTGVLIGLPVHGVTIPNVVAQSYVTSPLFDPRSLHKHLSSTEVERVGFLGWSKYAPGVDDLPGVISERDAFQRVTGGAAHLDTEITATSVRAEQPLHLACHGVSAGPHGDALLVLGQRNLPMLEILSKFEGSRPFVLLNACLTAHPAPGLAEQHLTLVKAFQVSGSHSVVGSLWAVADSDGIPEILIEGFYGELLQESVACHCERCIAAAMTRAISLLQSRGLDIPGR